jgi:integrase
MIQKITDFEHADTHAARWPKGKTPIFPIIQDKDTGAPIGIDFMNSPYCINDETEEDYGLQADSIISASMPENTRRAYTGDVFYFRQWVIHSNETWPATEKTILKFIIHHLEEMPPSVEDPLCNSGWKRTKGVHCLATVKRRLTSISIIHKFNNQEDPCDTTKVKALLSAMSKTKGKQKQSKAITRNILDNLISSCSGDSLINIRDRALILFMFGTGGRRRSEATEAIIENLEETDDGDYIYNIAKSKTDQQGRGQPVPVKGKAAIALREWLTESKISRGKIFLSVTKGGKTGIKALTGVDINRIVKKLCKRAGYDPSQFTSHGLRRGFVTQAGKEGCPLGDTMALSGHKSVPTAMKYYESGAIINNKASNLV